MYGSVNMTRSEATKLALDYVKEREKGGGGELLLLDHATMEGVAGWVFFYQSRAYIETGDFGQLLVGNAPIFISRVDGVVRETGTAHPVEYYLKEFGWEEKDRD